jgi:hypothetical protein
VTELANSSIPSEVKFDFDAMLMYGWVADSERIVVGINDSLRYWISTRDSLSGLLDDIEARKVTIRSLHASLLDAAQERETSELIERCLGRLEDYVVRLNSADRDNILGEVLERDQGYTVLFLYQKRGSNRRPLLGVRCIREGGTLLAGGDNARRVDLVIVSALRFDGATGRWMLESFQGQLQEAWSRVSAALATGTNAATIALMSRNMSHNIGSHSLFWLMQAEEGQRRRFYRYLQVRMELVAAFATEMPLSPSIFTFLGMVEEFKSNTMLMTTLCKTEGVEDIEIKYDSRDRRTIPVAIPGGDLGVQAFFALLENCIRDSAKYAVRADRKSLRITITAEDVGNLVRVSIFDNTKSYQQYGAEIGAAIREITFINSGGEMVSGNWGLKERFICATILRGTRPNAFRFKKRERDMSVGEQKPDGRNRILEVGDINGNLAWIFYLHKPGPSILHVSPTRGKSGTRTPEIETVAFENFRSNPAAARSVSSRYFVAHDLSMDDVGWLTQNRAKLPDRCFRSGSTGDLPGFTRLTQKEEASLTPEVLQRRIVDSLCKSKILPAVLLGYVGETQTQISRNPDVWVVPAKQNWDCLKSFAAERELIFVQRHYLGIPKTIPSNVIHYEPFNGSEELESFVSSCYRDTTVSSRVSILALQLVEAALTRILIADERLDPAYSQRQVVSTSFSERERLHWLGIDLMGSEYGADNDNTGADALFAALSGTNYSILLLHRGIMDKILRHDSRFRDANVLVAALRAQVPRLVVHSGRMDARSIPADVKLQSLSNVTRWLDTHATKIRIVDELSNLRRVE